MTDQPTLPPPPDLDAPDAAEVDESTADWDADESGTTDTEED